MTRSRRLAGLLHGPTVQRGPDASSQLLGLVDTGEVLHARVDHHRLGETFGHKSHIARLPAKPRPHRGQCLHRRCRGRCGLVVQIGSEAPRLGFPLEDAEVGDWCLPRLPGRGGTT